MCLIREEAEGQTCPCNKKGHFLQSLVNTSEVTSISSQFDIFMYSTIQTAVLGTVETVYKPLAPVAQNDLEFLIPGNTDTYIDLDIKLYVRCKMVTSSGKDVDLTDNFRGQ